MRPGDGVSQSCARPLPHHDLQPSLPGTDSESALAAALAHDLNVGFEALARAWQDRLYAFALRMTGSPSDAEELAQETLVRAWRALSDYPPERRRTLRIRSWLFQIAVNLARNNARSAGRATTMSLDALEGNSARDRSGENISPAARIPDEDPEGAPEESLERRQRLERLAGLLLALPEPHRLALTLRHIEGLSYGAIAEITGLPVGTAKSHASRGAAELRRAIEREQAIEAYREETELKR
jgi:RNA polymerase sigma-70 factor (ECF subfamily)